MDKFVKEHLIALEKAITQLNADWQKFQQTGQCPKCKAAVLGATESYDDVFNRISMIVCVICGKTIFPEGGRHLEKMYRQLKAFPKRVYGSQGRKAIVFC